VRSSPFFSLDNLGDLLGVSFMFLDMSLELVGFLGHIIQGSFCPLSLGDINVCPIFQSTDNC
jgi:hypothetical protein